MLIYRTPDNLDCLRNDAPVWATDGAVRIQSRLLAALLLKPVEFTWFKASTFTSDMHRRILIAVQKRNGDFEAWLKSYRGEHRSEVLDLLLRVSDWWEQRTPSDEEVKAMASTVEFYWRMQQRCLQSLNQAVRAWKGCK